MLAFGGSTAFTCALTVSRRLARTSRTMSLSRASADWSPPFPATTSNKPALRLRRVTLWLSWSTTSQPGAGTTAIPPAMLTAPAAEVRWALVVDGARVLDDEAAPVVVVVARDVVVVAWVVTPPPVVDGARVVVVVLGTARVVVVVLVATVTTGGGAGVGFVSFFLVSWVTRSPPPPRSARATTTMAMILPGLPPRCGAGIGA